MKGFARLSSAIALTLAIILCFSGCGLADFTRSLISGGETVEAGLNTPNNDKPTDKNPSNGVTNSAGINTTAPSTNPNTAQTNNAQNSQKPSVKPSQTITDSTNQTTQKPNTGIKEEPVKDIQDLLFATDPNTASKIMTIAGFDYDEEQGIFYSSMNPLQRQFGFNVIYDTAAPMTGMIYDTERIEFLYDGKEWMIQLWKGQYGITAGAEIGLYSRDPERVMQYDCADDEELIVMQYDFYNQGEKVFSRGPEKHWWLTGFKVFHVGIPFMITMDMTLKFTDNNMATQFLKALKKNQFGANAILNPINYKRTGSTIRVIWGSVPEGIEVANGKIM